MFVGPRHDARKTQDQRSRRWEFLSKIAALSEIQFSILKAFDIPQGILIGHGYNVSIADEGARYTEKEKDVMPATVPSKISPLQLTETQAGTIGGMHNFDNWECSLDLQRWTTARRGRLLEQ